MDELPELPFEKVLSYLSLQDRLKARAVSRAWYHRINSFKVKTLCCSERPIGLILGKGRWVSDAFARNFISSTRFKCFFKTFGHSILTSLKHLRLCDLDLTRTSETAFARTLNSFGQLEQLDMIRVRCAQQREFELTLPMLTSIHLEELRTNRKLTLEAPRLRQVRVLDCSGLRLGIVHGESVESLLIDSEYTEVKSLKNLEYLHKGGYTRVDSTLLSSLEQLKEFYTDDHRDIPNLFEQKQRNDRVDLKIYACGLLLNGPDDPTINAFPNSPRSLGSEAFGCLAANPSRLADVIPFYRHLDYSVIAPVAPGLEIDVLKRLTYLKEIRVHRPVQDVQRFLDLLKNFPNIVVLEFDGDQPQDLFDRLTEHCAVQRLTIHRKPSDLWFLLGLKHLTDLDVRCSVSAQLVRIAFEELPFLSWFTFRIGPGGRNVFYQVAIGICGPQQFRISGFLKNETFSDLNAAIEFLFGKAQQKRKAEELE